MSRWRHLRAIALLPGLATLGIPAAIVFVGEVKLAWGADGVALAVVVVVAGALLVAGLGLWARTVRLLARVGRGTLAPWDPTAELVVAGPYRHVRNPMITAVLAVLAAEVTLAGSVGLAIYTAAFAVGNHAFFLVYEEPALARRFGASYAAYCRNVPRWVPRRTPWRC